MKFLQRLEDILKAHKGGFLGGETAGAVDYILWPWIERLGALKVLKPGKLANCCRGMPSEGALIALGMQLDAPFRSICCVAPTVKQSASFTNPRSINC